MIEGARPRRRSMHPPKESIVSAVEDEFRRSRSSRSSTEHLPRAIKERDCVDQL
jgi:hypothetical protein